MRVLATIFLIGLLALLCRPVRAQSAPVAGDIAATDTAAPIVWRFISSNGFTNVFSLVDARPDDTGLDSVYVSDVVNVVFDPLPTVAAVRGHSDFHYTANAAGPGPSSFCIEAFDKAGNHDSKCYSVILDAAVGSPTQASLRLGLYPNPVTQLLHVRLDGSNEIQVQLEVLNVLGRVVLRRTLTKEVTALNVSDLAAGAYIVRIEGNSGVLASRAITIER